MRMVDAGFVMRPADTPHKMDLLRHLPARTFVGRTRNGRHYVIYADPDLCKCAFIGSDAALQTYHDMVTAGVAQPFNAPAAGAAPEERMIMDIDHDTDQLLGDDDYLGMPF